MLISAWNIIVQSFILYKKNWQQFLLYQLWIALPFIFTFFLTNNDGAVFSILKNHSIFFWPTIIIMALIIIGSIIISLWFSLSFMRAIAAAYTGKAPAKIELTVLQTIHSIWPAILTGILVGLTVLGGFLLIIIPGILFAVWFMFSIYAVAIDQIRYPIAAMKQSQMLVRHRWWRVFWRIFATGFFFGIIIFITEWLLALPAVAISQNVHLLTISIVNPIIGFLAGPLTTSAMIILYIELKRTPVEQKIPIPKNLPKV